MSSAVPSTALATAEQSFTLRPTSLKEALEFANIIAKSDLVPKDYKGKPENCLIAVQMGAEIGLPPLQAIQNIAVINGRPAVWGDGLRALILSAPDLVDIKEVDNGQVATCTITRKGRSPVTASFSMEDATKAGLTGKGGPWTQYPKRMRQMRAFAFAARDAYADRLRGLQVAEEQMDVEPREPAPTPSEPKRVGESATPAAQQQAAQAAASESKAETRKEETKAAPKAETKPAAPAANGNTEQVTRGAKVTGTNYVAADEKKGTKEYWEIQTDKGTFLTMDEQLYKSAASCEGTDHVFAITHKLVRRAGGTIAKLMTAIDLDEDAPAEGQGEQGGLLP